MLLVCGRLLEREGEERERDLGERVIYFLGLIKTIQVYVYTHINAYVYICIYIYIYRSIHTHTDTHTHALLGGCLARTPPPKILSVPRDAAGRKKK